MLTILAHGAMGYNDELIYLLSAIIFLGSLVVSWVNAQQEQDNE
ncbi:MAG: hypothetical protein AAFQ07_05985 [Chloroflexota bacterium]